MAGFRFRLQNVLDYRAGLADRARQELGVLQARVREAEEALAALFRAEQHALQQLGEAQRAPMMDLAEITRLLEYGQMLTARIAEQRGIIAERQQEADAKQQEVIALAQDAKALERLREHQLEEFQQDDARREQAETSEIAAIRHQRLQVL
jgi:flagellar export protein FliJ